MVLATGSQAVDCEVFTLCWRFIFRIVVMAIRRLPLKTSGWRIRALPVGVGMSE